MDKTIQTSKDIVFNNVLLPLSTDNQETVSFSLSVPPTLQGWSSFSYLNYAYANSTGNVALRPVAHSPIMPI